MLGENFETLQIKFKLNLEYMKDYVNLVVNRHIYTHSLHKISGKCISIWPDYLDKFLIHLSEVMQPNTKGEEEV